jgi:hypothetical protein
VLKSQRPLTAAIASALKALCARKKFPRRKHRIYGDPAYLDAADAFFHPDIHVLVIGALRQQGRQIDNGLLKHVAPVHWNHINLTGDYSPQNKRVRKADSGHSESEPNLNVPFPLSSNAPYSSPRRPNSLTETRNADRSEEDASFAGKALGGVPAETRSA